MSCVRCVMTSSSDRKVLDDWASIVRQRFLRVGYEKRRRWDDYDLCRMGWKIPLLSTHVFQAVTFFNRFRCSSKLVSDSLIQRLRRYETKMG